jgi:hypothetical protein
VNISSIFGITAHATAGAYPASKAGVLGADADRCCRLWYRWHQGECNLSRIHRHTPCATGESKRHRLHEVGQLYPIPAYGDPRRARRGSSVVSE